MVPRQLPSGARAQRARENRESGEIPLRAQRCEGDCSRTMPLALGAGKARGWNEPQSEDRPEGHIRGAHGQASPSRFFLKGE